ncbi:MAG TPA: hypothetical protein VF516_00190 [Kofleriaceae bacterium]
MPVGSTYENIRVNHGYEAWFLAVQGKSVRKLTEDIADDARAGCPIDSGDLVESIGTRYPGGLRGIVVVGTDHWVPTEYGSPPHIIYSHGPWSLRSDEGEYFGRVVHHPGTPAQPFMRPALYQRRKPVTV